MLQRQVKTEGLANEKRLSVMALAPDSHKVTSRQRIAVLHHESLACALH